MTGTHSQSQANAAEVIVIGGGPAGLCMALNLARYGIKSILIEMEVTTRWHPKGNTNNARTMEIFRQLGLADRVRELGIPAEHPFDLAFFTRYSGFEIARGRTPSRAERLALREAAGPTDQVVEPPHRANQMYVERFLFDRAAVCPLITLKFGWRAQSFAENADGVIVVAVAPDGARQVLHGRYVVGCDGGRGLVRKAFGIKYSGEAQLMNVYLSGLFTSVHLRIPDLYPRFLGLRRAWMYIAVNADDHVTMITLNGSDEFMLQLPTQPGVVLDERALVSRIQKAIGTDIAVEIIGSRQWTAGAYLVAEQYRHGRAFLAGDAAHLYTPTGGYGLNTGVDDTANLAWKLAAVIQGWGGERLLDSYEYERRQTALRSSDVARGLGKTRIKVDVPSAAEQDSEEGQIARSLIAQHSFVTTHHFLLPEDRDWLGVILGSRYDGSPLIISDVAPPTDSLEQYRPSDIPGGRAPHLWLDRGRGKGSSLYDRLGLGFTLMRFANGAPDVSKLENLARDRGIPLAVVDVALPEARELYSRNLYLVRPDHYIAWCGDDLPDDVGQLLDRVTGA